MTKFDSTYQEKPNFYGAPYQELQDYFKKHKLGHVLDLGCGQGRDALYLASIGFEVTAIDFSLVGVNQMIAQAKEQNVRVKGLAADIFDVQLDNTFDVILFDMVLHGFKDDEQRTLFKKYCGMLKGNGILCIVYPGDMRRDQFLSKIKENSGSWELIEEIDVHDIPHGQSDFIFKMMIVKRSE